MQIHMIIQMQIQLKCKYNDPNFPGVIPFVTLILLNCVVFIKLKAYQVNTNPTFNGTGGPNGPIFLVKIKIKPLTE